jgi:hypothetical protein
MWNEKGTAKICAELEQKFERPANLLRVARDVSVKERLADNPERETHHFLMRVALFSVVPIFQHTLRILDHCRCIRSNSRAVERGLRQPPLPQPEIAFAGQQAFAKKMSVRAQNSAFDVSARVCDQYLFYGVRMIDEDGPKIDYANARDVAIVARESRKEY